MGNSNLDQLFGRYLEGKTTEQENQKIKTLFEAMDNGDTKDLELSKEREDKIFSMLTSNEDNIKEIKSLRFKSEDKLRGEKWILRIAASMLVISLVAFGWFMKRSSSDNIFATSDEVKKVLLADGSIVWLRGESNLSYFEKANDGTRNADLNGDALFEIAKDSEHPFLLQYGDLTVKVVGTSFNLKRIESDLELTVLTGKVSLTAKGKDEAVFVEPGEKALYHRSSGVIEKITSNPTEIHTIISDTEYDMEFSNATLAEVADKIEKKFDVVIRFEDDGISNCHITANYSDHSLKATLEKITDVLHVQYSIEGKKVVLKGTPCK